MEESEYDKVTQASLNGIYVKAQEMDRGHNVAPAPSFIPPGASGDAESHAFTHASDAESHASDVEAHAGDAQTHASDAQVAGGVQPVADAVSHASTHASDGA